MRLYLWRFALVHVSTPHIAVQKRIYIETMLFETTYESFRGPYNFHHGHVVARSRQRARQKILAGQADLPKWAWMALEEGALRVSNGKWIREIRA